MSFQLAGISSLEDITCHFFDIWRCAVPLCSSCLVSAFSLSRRQIGAMGVCLRRNHLEPRVREQVRGQVGLQLQGFPEVGHFLRTPCVRILNLFFRDFSSWGGVFHLRQPAFGKQEGGVTVCTPLTGWGQAGGPRSSGNDLLAPCPAPDVQRGRGPGQVETLPPVRT